MKRKVIEIILVIIGITAIGFPVISKFVNSYTETTVISNYQEDINKLTEEQKEEELRKAQEYNDEISQEGIVDISLDKKKDGEDSGYVSYLNVLNIGNAIGYINIPKLNVNLPIYHGISESVLQTGVGHLQGTSLPIGGQGTHAVLAGHTGLASNKIFDDLEKLAIGDRFYIYVLNKTLEYEVDDIKVVKPEAVDAIERNPEKDYVTLITCTPYMVNSHRLLVRGVRVEPSDDATSQTSDSQMNNIQNINNLKNRKKREMLLIITIFVIATIFLILWITRGKENKEEKNSEQNSER